MTHSKSEGLAAGGGLGRDSGQAGFGFFTRIEQALRYVLQVRDCGRHWQGRFFGKFGCEWSMTKAESGRLLRLRPGQ